MGEAGPTGASIDCIPASVAAIRYFGNEILSFWWRLRQRHFLGDLRGRKP